MPDLSTPLPSPAHRHRLRTAVVIALAGVLGLAGCAEVDLDDLMRSQASPTPSAAAAIPSGMVMPTDLPSIQSTTPSQVTVDFPAIEGYDRAAEPSAEPSSGTGGTTQSASWSSRTTMCSIQAQVVSGTDLLVTGGDDRQLSQSWADSLADSFRSYKVTSQRELTIQLGDDGVEGVATAFIARVSGSDVTGRTFVRVWSDDGAALQLTEICQRGAFDETAWTSLERGTTISGLSGDSIWPGTTTEDEATAPSSTTASPTSPTATSAPSATATAH